MKHLQALRPPLRAAEAFRARIGVNRFFLAV